MKINCPSIASTGVKFKVHIYWNRIARLHLGDAFYFAVSHISDELYLENDFSANMIREAQGSLHKLQRHQEDDEGRTLPNNKTCPKYSFSVDKMQLGHWKTVCFKIHQKMRPAIKHSATRIMNPIVIARVPLHVGRWLLCCRLRRVTSVNGISLSILSDYEPIYHVNRGNFVYRVVFLHYLTG